MNQYHCSYESLSMSLILCSASWEAESWSNSSAKLYDFLFTRFHILFILYICRTIVRHAISIIPFKLEEIYNTLRRLNFCLLQSAGLKSGRHSPKFSIVSLQKTYVSAIFQGSFHVVAHKAFIQIRRYLARTCPQMLSTSSFSASR